MFLFILFSFKLFYWKQKNTFKYTIYHLIGLIKAKQKPNYISAIRKVMVLQYGQRRKTELELGN